MITELPNVGPTGCGLALIAATFAVFVSDTLVLNSSGLMYDGKLCGSEILCAGETGIVFCWRCGHRVGVVKQTEAEHAERVREQLAAYAGHMGTDSTNSAMTTFDASSICCKVLATLKSLVTNFLALVQYRSGSGLML